MTRPRLAAAAVLAALLCSLPACAGGSAAAPPTMPTSVSELPTMDAATFSQLIANQHGTPVLVNIWASWCTPCQEETPDLVRAHTMWGNRVRFIGVDAQDNRSGAIQFLGDYGVTYPSVFDPGNDIPVSYGLFSPPATLFFDADGTLVKTVPMQISPHDLRANIRAIAS
jgi:cytochrome c biogenesis protein CcmG, thiol:disulfide interchange protein DsbE